MQIKAKRASKLVIHKETLRRLSSDELIKVAGGGSVRTGVCNTENMCPGSGECHIPVLQVQD